jgi:hypothetical protein
MLAEVHVSVLAIRAPLDHRAIPTTASSRGIARRACNRNLPRRSVTIGTGRGWWSIVDLGSPVLRDRAFTCGHSASPGRRDRSGELVQLDEVNLDVPADAVASDPALRDPDAQRTRGAVKVLSANPQTNKTLGWTRTSDSAPRPAGRDIVACSHDDGNPFGRHERRAHSTPV